MADFQDEPTAGIQAVEGLGNEAADEVETVVAGEQGERRIVHDLTSEGGAVGFRDVGEIGDDAVENTVNGGEEVALDEVRVGNLEGSGVFPRKGEGVWGDVGEGGVPAGSGSGEGEAEHAGAATHVEDPLAGGQVPGENPLGEFLSLRAGNEGAGVGFELVFVEPDRSEQVLDGDAFTAFLQGFAKGREVGFFQRAVELEVKVHPGTAELVGDEHLHVPAGVLDTALFEIAGAAIDGFQNGAHS